jgi:hypothetical protein
MIKQNNKIEKIISFSLYYIKLKRDYPSRTAYNKTGGFTMPLSGICIRR